MSSPDITENDSASHISGAEGMAPASSPDTPDPRHLRAPLTHCPAEDRESERALVEISGPESLPAGWANQGTAGYPPQYTVSDKNVDVVDVVTCTLRFV